MEKLLSVEELAGWLGVSPFTIYNWAARSTLPVVKVGTRLMFDPQQIRRWLRQRSRLELRGIERPRRTTLARAPASPPTKPTHQAPRRDERHE